jgi:hypothetical protein
VGAAMLQAVKGQHNKVSAEEAIAAIKRQGDDDADALSAQDEAVIAQLFSQRATQVWSRPPPRACAGLRTIVVALPSGCPV